MQRTGSDSAAVSQPGAGADQGRRPSDAAATNGESPPASQAPGGLSHRDDAADGEAGLRELTLEWGETETATNKRLLLDYFKRMPSEEREQLLSERLPDGRRKINDPAWARTVLKELRGGGSAAAGKTREERIEEIREVMRTDRKRYNRDLRLQAEYRDLLRGSN